MGYFSFLAMFIMMSLVWSFSRYLTYILKELCQSSDLWKSCCCCCCCYLQYFGIHSFCHPPLPPPPTITTIGYTMQLLNLSSEFLKFLFTFLVFVSGLGEYFCLMFYFTKSLFISLSLSTMLWKSSNEELLFLSF